jgi:two-component system sensor histidine kinase BaeS
MLGLVAAVLALFVVSQLVALTDAGDRLVESAGSTPAEYARSGFFQLCWATGLLLAFLAVVRAVADPAALRNRVVVLLGAAVPVLAVGLVIVSLRRMALYDAAFGLTMLRLWVVGAALWMGAVLLMVAARNLGVGAGRQWLVAGGSLAALILTVVANVIDPEAFVARHNLERARDGATLDIGYLAGLSDDVLPVVADAIGAEADPMRRDELIEALRCGDRAHGVATLNVAARRATELRKEHCGP